MHILDHAATTAVIMQLYAAREELRYTLAELIVVDRSHYLHMLEHSIQLQELARRLFTFARVVSNNAVNPYLKATADLELASLLEIATSIEPLEPLELTTDIELTTP